MSQIEKKPRGFAGMDPDLRRKLAAAGGRAAHKNGGAHEFTSEEARVVGRLGGLATAERRRAEREKKLQNAAE